MSFKPGELHINHVLTEQDVIQIRLAYQNKEKTQAQLAKQFGVDARQIYRIVNWQSWIHVWDERFE